MQVRTYAENSVQKCSIKTSTAYSAFISALGLHCVLQISTSVQRITEDVTLMPIVQTVTEVSRARATLDTPEMESPAQVSVAQLRITVQQCGHVS